MRSERIAELREIAAAATPGPIDAQRYSVLPLTPSGSLWLLGKAGVEVFVGRATTGGDARLWAAASTAVPELLDEIERLTAERDALRAALREYGPKCAGWIGDKSCGRIGVARDPQMDGLVYGWCDVHRIERAKRDFAHAAILRTLNEETER